MNPIEFPAQANTPGRPATSGLSRIVNRIGRLMSLIRAYNDLRRVGPDTLRRIGDDRHELNRVLNGQPPRGINHDKG